MTRAVAFIDQDTSVAIAANTLCVIEGTSPTDAYTLVPTVVSVNPTTGVITGASLPAGGDVDGPASATLNAVALYADTTGKVIKNSLMLVDGSGNVTGVAAITATDDIVTTGGDLIASRSAAGATVSGQVTNSDNTNGASNAQLQLAVGGASSGDPGMLFQVSGVAAGSWYIALDNSASDALLIGEGEAVGTTPAISIAHTSLDVAIVAGDLSTTAGAITSATTLTATSGDITATSGNFVASAAGTGLALVPTIATGAASGAVVADGRLVVVTFTSVSIAADADLTLTITNSAVAGASTATIVDFAGGTTGSALSKKSVTNSAGSTAIVITNGTGATTSTADIVVTCLVVS